MLCRQVAACVQPQTMGPEQHACVAAHEGASAHGHPSCTPDRPSPPLLCNWPSHPRTPMLLHVRALAFFLSGGGVTLHVVLAGAFAAAGRGGRLRAAAGGGGARAAAGGPAPPAGRAGRHQRRHAAPAGRAQGVRGGSGPQRHGQRGGRAGEDSGQQAARCLLQYDTMHSIVLLPCMWIMVSGVYVPVRLPARVHVNWRVCWCNSTPSTTAASVQLVHAQVGTPSPPSHVTGIHTSPTSTPLPLHCRPTLTEAPAGPGPGRGSRGRRRQRGLGRCGGALHAAAGGGAAAPGEGGGYGAAGHGGVLGPHAARGAAAGRADTAPGSGGVTARRFRETCQRLAAAVQGRRAVDEGFASSRFEFE